MSKKQQPSNYMKYAGWGFQLFVFLFIAFIGGKYLDEYFGFDTPYIGITLAFAVLIIQFYTLIKDLNQN